MSSPLLSFLIGLFPQLSASTIIWSDDMSTPNKWKGDWQSASNPQSQDIYNGCPSCCESGPCAYMSGGGGSLSNDHESNFIQRDHNTLDFYNIQLRFSIFPLGLQDQDFCRVSYRSAGAPWKIVTQFDQFQDNKLYSQQIFNLDADANNQQILSVRFETIGTSPWHQCYVDEVSLFGTQGTNGATSIPTVAGDDDDMESTVDVNDFNELNHLIYDMVPLLSSTLEHSDPVDERMAIMDVQNPSTLKSPIYQSMAILIVILCAVLVPMAVVIIWCTLRVCIKQKDQSPLKEDILENGNGIEFIHETVDRIPVDDITEDDYSVFPLPSVHRKEYVEDYSHSESYCVRDGEGVHYDALNIVSEQDLCSKADEMDLVLSIVL